MTVGPVEYLLLSYREGRLGAGGGRDYEAWRLVTSGTIRILDLTVIKKDEHGDIEVSVLDIEGVAERLVEPDPVCRGRGGRLVLSRGARWEW